MATKKKASVVVVTKKGSTAATVAAGGAGVVAAGAGGVALYHYIKSRMPAQPDQWDIFAQYVSGADSRKIIGCFLDRKPCFLEHVPCPRDIELLAYLCVARFNVAPAYYTEALRYLSFHGLNLKTLYDTYPTEAPIAQISPALKDTVNRIFQWEKQCAAGKKPPNGQSCVTLIKEKGKALRAIKACLDTVHDKSSVQAYIAACKELTSLLPSQQATLTSLSVLASFAPIEHYNELFGFKLTTNESVLIQALVQLNPAYDDALYTLAGAADYSPVYLVFMDLVLKAFDTSDSASMAFYAPRIQRVRKANTAFTLFTYPTFFNPEVYPKWVVAVSRGPQNELKDFSSQPVSPASVVSDPKVREKTLARIYAVLTQTHDTVHMIMASGTFKFTAVVQCDAVLLKLLNGNNTDLTIGPKKLTFRAWVTECLATLTKDETEVETILKFVETLVPNLRQYGDVYLEGDAQKITALTDDLKAKFGWYSPALGIKLKGVIGNFVPPTKADLLEVLTYVDQYPDCQTRYEALLARGKVDLK